MIDSEELRELQANFESTRLDRQTQHKAWEKFSSRIRSAISAQQRAQRNAQQGEFLLLGEMEYEQARRLPNFHLYVVFDVKSNTPKIWRIPGNFAPNRFLLKASEFKVTVRVGNHD
jgi:hypothetical protein